MKRQHLLCWAATVLLCATAASQGQSSLVGLIAIKASDNAEGMEKKLTTSRLFVLGPTNQYKLPVLRLAITDKPFMTGRLSFFEGTVVSASNTMQAFKIPLAADQARRTAYAQMVDVPITNGPVLDMLVAMFNAPPSATVAVDVVDEDDASRSKSYIVPLAGIQQLRKEYLQVKAAK